MNLCNLCALLFIFGGTSSTSSCDNPSVDSSDDHCIDIEDSTTILEDEGVTFFDQLNDHAINAERPEIDTRGDFDGTASKWYPESFAYEDSPLEASLEVTTNTLVRKDVIDVFRNFTGESSLHNKEESTSVKQTDDNELHAHDVDGLTLTEKKDLSSPVKSLGAEKKESKTSRRSSSGSRDERLFNQTSSAAAEVLATPPKQNSSQETHERISELLDSKKRTYENEFKSSETVGISKHLNNTEMFNKIEMRSTSVDDITRGDREIVTVKDNDNAQQISDKTGYRQKDVPLETPYERDGITVLETKVKILKENKREVKSGNKSKHPDTPILTEETLVMSVIKPEEQLVDSSSVEVVKCGDNLDKNYDSSLSVRTASIPETFRTTPMPKFENQFMTFDLLKLVSPEETELGIQDEGSENKESYRQNSEVGAEDARVGPAEIISPDVTSGSTSDDKRSVEARREDDLSRDRSTERAEELGGASVATPERLVAEEGGEEAEESGESVWSTRTREGHAEVIRWFRHSRDTPGVPNRSPPEVQPAAAAQFQRRPSRLSDAPPELVFPAVPQGDAFHIQELGLSDGVFLFSYLGNFLSLLQPREFPIDLIRDALWNRVSVVNLITQSLQAEAGFIACLTVGVLIAVSLPCYVTVHACCARTRRGRQQSGDGDWDDGDLAPSDCRKKVLLFVLHVLLLLIGLGVGAMFATNEQMAGALGRTPRVLHTALTDATTFLRNSNRQLRAVITESLDRALTAASDDLDNVEMLLGEPIQNELAIETGVDVALDTLVDVGSAAAVISAKVGFMLAYGAETRDLVLEARDRLHDLRQQVESFRRQCPTRDRPLCETVDPNGLDAAMRLDQLLDDRRLGEIHDLREANLSTLAQQVKAEFQKIPQHVEEQTREARIAVRRQLARQRTQVDDEAWALDAVTRDLAARVEDARDKALLLVRGLADIEYWRWFTALGASIAVVLMWVLMLAGLACSCCGPQQKAAPTLLASVVVVSLLSLALWLLALGSLVVGGHGEVFVCRPLYDEPEFSALTGLLDRPGVVFRRGGGFLSNLLYGNDTLDVPLRDVLMECQDNRPTYKAFKLRSVYDVNAASDHRTWDALHDDLSRLQVNLTGLRLLTPDLQRQLTSLVASSAVNLTAHRVQLSRQVTGKDLSSFADQLESVANQIKDLATASRMETLASRTRRLLVSHIQPLEQRKEDLVYQLTALEVQIQPLQRQVNQSLSHLKTIQYFINNQGDSISKQKAKDYVRRLLSYVDQYRDHVLKSTGDHVAPCKPVWDVYHAIRQLLCRHILDPLNGFWFSSVWCLLLFLAASPLCLKLAEACRDASDRSGLLQPANSDSPSQTLMMPESNTWSSSNRAGESDGW